MEQATCGKVVLVGDSCVGKTSIITSIQKLPFNAQTSPTIVAVHRIERTIAGETFSIDLWDTAGQDQYAALVSNYLHEAKAVLFVFSVTDKVSLEAIPGWLDVVNEREAVPLKFLVGNKTDCTRTVSMEDGSDLGATLQLPYFETSAKTGSGIEDLITEVMTRLGPLPSPPPPPQVSVVTPEPRCSTSRVC
jgi:small GTP-binding protein